MLARLPKRKSFPKILFFVPIAVIAVAVFFFGKPVYNNTVLNPSNASLPDISYFLTHPTDQFLTDWDVMQTGHPFKGKRANTPHTGGHIDYGDDYKTWPRGGTAPSNYPPIYAVVDGVVGRIDYSFPVSPNDRYGVSINFAKKGATLYSFDYSIEPFIKEPSKDFYRQFILVKEGDQVRKGQIIAYMYTSKAGSNGTHIHFQISANNQFLAPAIFTPAVVQKFHDHWADFGYDGPPSPGSKIPVCMGYKLTPEENPFESKAVDCL